MARLRADTPKAGERQPDCELPSRRVVGDRHDWEGHELEGRVDDRSSIVAPGAACVTPGPASQGSAGRAECAQCLSPALSGHGEDGMLRAHRDGARRVARREHVAAVVGYPRPC